MRPSPLLLRTLLLVAMITLAVLPTAPRAQAPLELAQTLAPVTFGDGGPEDHYGGAVAVSGDIAVVGAPRDVVGDDRRGAVYVYRREGASWSLIQKLWGELPVVLPGAAGRYFGQSLDLDGDVLVVGQPADPGDSGAAVFVYRRGPDGFAYEERFWSMRPSFGASVAVRGDLLAVGVPLADGAAGTAQGQVVVYRRDRNTGNWSQFQTLEEFNAEANARFGQALDLDRATTPGSEVLAVGAPARTVIVSGVPRALAGRVQVFEMNSGGSALVFNNSLVAATPQIGAQFGTTLSLGRSGGLGTGVDRLLIGAPLEDVSGIGNAGRVHLATRGTLFWETSGSSTLGGAVADDRYGSAVALDGGRVVVGANGVAQGGEADAGAIYVGTANAAFTAVTVSRRSWPTAAPGPALLGSAVAIDGGQFTVLAGGPLATIGGQTTQGAAAFSIGSLATPFPAALTRLDSGVGASDAGFGTALATDDDLMLVGAPGDNVDGMPGRGSVSAYRRIGDTWQFEARVVAPDGAAGDGFGTSVALSAGLAIIGAPGRDVISADRGRGYAFVRVGDAWQFERSFDPEVAGTVGWGTWSCTADGVMVLGSRGDAAAKGLAIWFRAAAGAWTLLSEGEDFSPQPGPRRCAMSRDHLALAYPAQTVGTVPPLVEAGAILWTRIDRASAVPTLAPAGGVGGNAAGQRLGDALAIAGDQLAASLRTPASGRVQLYAFGPSGWQPQANLGAVDGFPNDGFGVALVAAPDRVWVGMRATAGAQRVLPLVRSAGTWSLGTATPVAVSINALARAGDGFALASTTEAGPPPFGNRGEGRVRVWRPRSETLLIDGFEAPIP